MISARERTRVYDVGLLDYERVRVEMFVEPETGGLPTTEVSLS